MRAYVLPQGYDVEGHNNGEFCHGFLLHLMQAHRNGGPRCVEDTDAGFQFPPVSCSFELRVYGQRQRLGGYQWDIEGPKTLAGPQYLLWAGDLDSDNKLDLLMSFQDRGWNTVLFLSSLAKPGELVGEAGRFNYWPPNDPGC